MAVRTFVNPPSGRTLPRLTRMLTNNARHAVAHAMLMTPDGVEGLVVAVRATYPWRRDGSLEPLAEQPPVRPVDVYSGDPASSGLVSAAELTLPKPRVDVLLEGEIVPPEPVEQTDFMLEVGRRVRKAVRVVGPRAFVPSARRDLVTSRPQVRSSSELSSTRCTLDSAAAGA